MTAGKNGDGLQHGTSIVRENLMTRPGYTPYCGALNCTHWWPRTQWAGGQFACRCGWRSSFDADFVAAYVVRWAAVEAREQRGMVDRTFGLPIALQKSRD
ncbi:MAG: hypothetical protein KDJ44_09240 [Rhodoblastus sp.]|nr:hypothetical protein [Rhodoblastus sp.]